MAISMNDVRTYLDPEEVDYVAASMLGPQALPFLDELVHGTDSMLASKAAYLTTLIPGDEQSRILADAARSASPTLRVAVASGLANLAESHADSLADDLLSDQDVGVRKHALKAVGTFESPTMTDRVRRVAEADPEPLLRNLAVQSLDSPHPA